MSYFKHLEQQLQNLELIKSESIRAAEFEHFKSIALINIEKEKKHLKNKENFDDALRIIAYKYTNTTTSPTNQETEKPQSDEINYAKTLYHNENTRIEEEFKIKKIEIDAVLSLTLDRIAAEHSENIIIKKKLYASALQKMEVESSLANNIYISKEQEITRNYQIKSKQLHQGATKTHSILGWQLSELKDTGIYLESYRLLAKIIGLNGITDDVGTFVSKDSVYNNVKPMITYLDFYVELKNHYKRKDLIGLINDFYTPNSESSSEIVPILKNLELKESDALSEEYLPQYNSQWYKSFAISIKSNRAFRNHIHSVMAKYNQRLAQMHGWETMPLTKIHLYISSDINESPFNQTPWHALSEEYKQMQSVVSSEYYKREEQLKKERDMALIEEQKVLKISLENAEKNMLETLQQDKADYEIDIHTSANLTDKPSANIEQIIQATPIQTIQKSLPKNHNPQTLFAKPKATSLYTIHEAVDIDENDVDDPEICDIFKLKH